MDSLVLSKELLKNPCLSREDNFVDFMLFATFNFESEVGELPSRCKPVHRQYLV
jgi:hypothetical protein